MLFYSGLLDSLKHWRLRRRDRLEIRRWRDTGKLNRSRITVSVLSAIHIIEALIDGEVNKVEIGLWINTAPPFVRNYLLNGKPAVDANIEPQNIEVIASRVLDVIDFWKIQEQE